MDYLLSLLTLTFMEIVLGIDNIIFIAILVAKLPLERQPAARNTGIVLALLIRIGLLFSIAWVMSLDQPFMEVIGHSFSGRDLILLAGGLFLIAKSTFEIHSKMESVALPVNQNDSDKTTPRTDDQSQVGFGSIIVQILILDIVFSLDSVITAVGMAKEISIMVTAMVIAMVVMLVSAKMISNFVDRHPTIKVLALSFLILIGVMLVMEGMGQHVNKGYIYFAMFFSLAVEMINMRVRKSSLEIS